MDGAVADDNTLAAVEEAEGASVGAGGAAAGFFHKQLARRVIPWDNVTCT